MIKIVHNKSLDIFRARILEAWGQIQNTVKAEGDLSGLDEHDLKRLCDMVNVFSASLANLMVDMAKKGVERVDKECDEIEALLTAEQRERLRFLKK